MGTIVEIRLPAAEFAFEETLTHVSGVHFDLDRITVLSDDRLSSLVTATAGDPNQLDEFLSVDPSVDAIESLSVNDNEQLFRIEWTTRGRFLSFAISKADATVLSLSSVGMTWMLQMLVPDRDVLSALYAFCRDRGLTFDVQNLYEPNKVVHRDNFGLTGDQEEALILAVDCGYFDVPRSATMDELGEILGISRQAVSERLRRGHSRMVESALILGKSSTDLSLLTQ